MSQFLVPLLVSNRVPHNVLTNHVYLFVCNYSHAAITDRVVSTNNMFKRFALKQSGPRICVSENLMKALVDKKLLMLILKVQRQEQACIVRETWSLSSCLSGTTCASVMLRLAWLHLFYTNFVNRNTDLNILYDLQ